MEFSIDIHTKLNGEIIVEDFSKEYNLYTREYDDVWTKDKYKYSQSASLNTITKMSTDEITLVDVLLDEHKEDVDSVTFNVDKDGYYVVTHIILPTKEWYDKLTELLKENYTTIYIVSESKLYKEVKGELEETTVREILERNTEGTTIFKCVVDVFHTGHLQECYINYCKRIFDALLNKCAKHTYDEDIYARDFIWMTLNIIDYLVGFKQFLEALRILEVFDSCGGYCNDKKLHGIKNMSGCGCSKT